MSERSHIKKWKTGDDDPARSNDGSLLGGQKVKSGLFFKLTIGMGLLAIIGTFAIPTLKKPENDLQQIITAPNDQLNSIELAKILNNQTADMKHQTPINEKEIQGKIIEWELEILVVATLPDHYKILTKPTSKYPGSLLTLYPQNNQQKTYIETVQPGTRIKIKGKITGLIQGKIIINPALLI